MDREDVIQLLSSKMKLIRVEQGYTQDKMADVLGISKKTLVQIEKGRTLAGWTTTVAVCALFRDSQVLVSQLGDEPIEVIEIIAHDGVDRPKEKTLGGKVWWRDLLNRENFRLQQNLVSQHYRILDEHDYRWHSTFDEREAKGRFEELADKKTDNME